MPGRAATVIRRHKYGAKKAPCRSGHTHDSGKEAKRCDELHLLLRAGQISDLQVQEQFWFSINGVQVKHGNGRRVGMKVDFVYWEGAKRVAEDSKGFVVRDWPLRAAIFRALHPDIELRET